MKVGTFPFGQPILHVTQQDRKPKRVFILGVYASAVHARWRDAQGMEIVRALAVASEPYIFWCGDGVEDILSNIDVPLRAGRLEPAARNLNGPSGRSIDEDYLKPLGLKRSDTWLCDIIPYSCMNRGQANAVESRYEPRAKQFSLPPVAWPTVPRKLVNPARPREVAAELQESNAEIVITLGDLPLKWFGRAFGSQPVLGAYGKDAQHYGRLHDIEINGRRLKLLPLVHPRQAAGLGGHNSEWRVLHTTWIKETAPGTLNSL